MKGIFLAFACCAALDISAGAETHWRWTGQISGGGVILNSVLLGIAIVAVIWGVSSRGRK